MLIHWPELAKPEYGFEQGDAFRIHALREEHFVRDDPKFIALTSKARDLLKKQDILIARTGVLRKDNDI